MALADDRWRYVGGPHHSIKLTTGAAVYQGQPLKWSTGTVIPVAAAGDTVMGIAEHDAASGAEVAVMVAYGALIEAEVAASATTIVAGTPVFSAAPSTNAHYIVSDTGTGNPASGKIACGVCVVGAAAGAKAQFLFTPQGAFNGATGVVTVSA